MGGKVRGIGIGGGDAVSVKKCCSWIVIMVQCEKKDGNQYDKNRAKRRNTKRKMGRSAGKKNVLLR